MIRTLIVVFALSTSVLTGCGGADRPELVPVSGTVNYKGSPVEGATVTFATEKAARSSSGVTDASGKFRLTTFDTNDGAPIGEHVVTISKVEAQAANGMQSSSATPEQMQEMMAKQTGQMKGKMEDVAPKMILPTKYADAKTSGEKRTVAAGDANDFKFELND